MRLDSIDLYRVRLPLVYPFRTAYGDAHAIESVLVRMQGVGAAGWGEATPWESPRYSPEWAAGAYSLARDWLAPQLVGRDIGSGAELQAVLAPFKGNPFAKAALDLAWWDLEARLRGKPLWQLVGGRSDRVEVGADFGVMETVAALLDSVAGACAAGFKRVKLKFRPGWEIDVVRAVRLAFPDLVFHVDCNAAYALSDLELFRALDELAPAMVEQPLAHDDLLDHARLQRQIRTPVCLDESITSPRAARQALEVGACRYLNVKPGRVGGITPALEILEAGREAGVSCWIGGMLESAIGASHCLALATLPGVSYPSDIFPSRRFYDHDLTRPEIELAGPSVIRAFDGPGIGCQPEGEVLAVRTVESCTVRPSTVSASC